jgi:hypothetical protein
MSSTMAKRPPQPKQPSAKTPPREWPRLGLSVLFERLIHPSIKAPIPQIVLADAPIVKRLVRERATAAAQGKGGNEVGPPQICTDLNDLTTAVDQLASPPLFGNVQPLIIELPEKLGKTHAQELTRQVSRLIQAKGGTTYADNNHKYDNAPFWILGLTPHRKSVEPFEGLEAALCYGPSRQEAPKLLNLLLDRYPRLKQQDAPAQNTLTQQALAVYDLDLTLADDHFARMESTGLGFQEVFTDLPMLGLFALMDALPNESPLGSQTRLEQCLQNGEDPNRILMSLSSYLRQLVQLKALIDQGHLPNQAFAALGVPFPAQAKFSAGMRRFSMAKVVAFCANAANTELNLRQSYRAADTLRIELSKLFA